MASRSMSRALMAVAILSVSLPAPAADRSAADEVRMLESQMWEDWKNKNYSAMRQRMADDAVFVADRPIDADQLVTLMTNARCDATRVTLDDVRVTMLTADVAHIAYVVRSEGACNGVPISPEGDAAMSVWVKRDGTWKTASHLQSPRGSNPAVERARLQESDVQYTAAAAKKDVAGFASMYGAGAALYAPNAVAILDAPGIRRFADDFAKLPGLSIRLSPLIAEVSQSGDIAYTIASYELTGTMPDGNAVNDRGRDVHIWKKQADGTWKIVVDIWNSEIPAAPAH